MNLQNLVITMFVFLILLAQVNTGRKAIEKIEKEIHQIRKETECMNYVSESFRNACKGEGFYDLNQWQKTCRNLWELDYIAYGPADELIDYPSEKKNLDGEKLLYAVWTGPYGNGEVFQFSKLNEVEDE